MRQIGETGGSPLIKTPKSGKFCLKVAFCNKKRGGKAMATDAQNKAEMVAEFIEAAIDEAQTALSVALELIEELRT